MKNNYHTHTFRCNHAIGDEHDMIQAALKLGLEGIGFSDHIPYPILRNEVELSKRIAVQPGMRMNYNQMQEHLDVVDQCQKKYKNIQIYQGFEAEYFPIYNDYYRELLDSKKIDYLILGHHFHVSKNEFCYYGKDHMSEEEILRYGKEVVEGLETKLFSYLAHPDLFMQGSHHFTETCKETSYLICRKAKELNIPLELNAGRLHYPKKEIDGILTYPYPNDHFWKIASEIGNDVVIGLDVHQKATFNQDYINELEAFAGKYHLHVLDKIEFKKG